MARIYWQVLGGALALSVSGCAAPAWLMGGPDAGAPAATPTAPTMIEAPAPPEDARSVEEFDTTSAQDRAAAVEAAMPTGAEQLLGRVVASLGSPTDPGLWAATPLVDRPREGRLFDPAKGTSVVVELRPLSDGPTQVSLAALRLLEASLADLVELEIYAR